MKPLSVLVVEDVPRLLKAQLQMLETHPELQVVGSAMSGEEAVTLCDRLAPRVVLLDLGLPGMDGIATTRAIKAKHPSVEILIFTVFDEEEKVLDAVKAGASGYLLKGAPSEKVIDALREVAAGGSVIQPNLARRLLSLFRVEPTTAQTLSPRETEILQLIGKGSTNPEAAALLGISRATVCTHLENIYRKLDVTNRVEAVTEGLRQGIITG
ncbi:MAG: response regulator [Myxococcaceae bacterium]